MPWTRERPREGEVPPAIAIEGIVRVGFRLVFNWRVGNLWMRQGFRLRAIMKPLSYIRRAHDPPRWR